MNYDPDLYRDLNEKPHWWNVCLEIRLPHNNNALKFSTIIRRRKQGLTRRGIEEAAKQLQIRGEYVVVGCSYLGQMSESEFERE